MKRLALVVVALGGCISSNSSVCSNDSICPAGTVCDPHNLCVLPDQLTACDNKQEADACTFSGGSGHCLGGVCLPTTCGDGVVEVGEMCDPTDGSPCSADCTSNLKCGNGVIDVDKGETCDDGNFLDNDGCSSSCIAELAHWVRHALNPGPRSQVGMTFDAARKRVIGFAGFVGVGASGSSDTLEWVGSDWLLSPARTSPPSRSGAGIAYDAERGLTVLFGGFDGVFSMRDTWLWDGYDWRAPEVTGPDPRSNHVLVYDPKRKVTVMYGGYGDEDGDHDDTWEWDGAKWTHVLTPSPPAREAAQAAFDPEHGVIVLTGGHNNGTYYADTWTYDGAWHDVTPSGVSPQIYGGAMAWDPSTQRVVLFGGIKMFTQVATVYTWDGTAWTAGTAMPMGARTGLAATNMGNRVMVFGGVSGPTLFDDTWFYANGTWSQPTPIGGRQGAVTFNQPASRDAILFGGLTANNAYSAQTLELATTATTVRAGAPPSARAFACAGWDEAKNIGVLFGGEINATNTTVADTWIWNGVGWAQKVPAHAPSGRYHASCAFDGKNVTLIGGLTSSTTAATDAFSWDGNDWINVPLPAGFTPRSEADVAYDPIRKVMVVHGGQPLFGTGSNLVDTWTYDGVTGTWTEATSALTPNGREGGVMRWNAARERLVVGGGILSGFDSYEWDGTQWHTLAVGPEPTAFQFGEAYSSLDGGGIMVYGGVAAAGAYPPVGYELRWEASKQHEQCDGTDADGDGLTGCADPDCWSICTPACMPGVANCDPMTGPHCGDGICDGGRETGRTCPADCPLTIVCGDLICDPGETGCPGDCP